MTVIAFHSSTVNFHSSTYSNIMSTTDKPYPFSYLHPTVHYQMAFDMKSLVELATTISVKHANVLRAHVDIIPPILYHALLLASVKTNRILSIRILLSSWPLEEMCLTHCADLTPEHAAMMAHCLQEGCKKLRFVDLSSCNTGVQGTKLLLRLATGRRLPKVNEYGISNGQSGNISSGTALPRLQLKMDCYIDQENFPLFLEALDNLTVFDFNVSCLHAVELGSKRIKKLLRKMKLHQAEFVNGLNFEMNGLPYLDIRNPVTSSTNSSCINGQHKSSVYCFTALNNFCHLRYLNLSGNVIGQLVIFMMLKNIPNGAHLTHLLLNSCNIGPEKHCINEISQLCCIQKLEHLELANNKLESLNHLMNLFSKCRSTLHFLNLEMNSLKQGSLPLVQQLLKTPFQLKQLYVGKNQLGNDLQLLNRSSCHIKF